MPRGAVWPKAGVLEAFAIFAVIMAYIWVWRFTHPWLWLPVVALILVSHFAHRDGATAVGLRIANFGVCARRFGPVLIGLALAMLTLGLVLGTIRPLGFEPALESFAVYLPWGLFRIRPTNPGQGRAAFHRAGVSGATSDNFLWFIPGRTASR